MFMFILTLYSCEGKKVVKEKTPTELGMMYDNSDYLMKYVCVDRTGCLHCTRECYFLDSVYQVLFVDTIELTKDKYRRYCSECISIPKYERIERIINRNEKVYIWTPDGESKERSNYK